MRLDKKNMHKIEWLIVFTVLVIICCFRFDLVAAVIKGIIRLLTPFMLGAAMAFGINLLMRFLERKLFDNRHAKKYRVLQKIRRPVSIVLSLLIIAGVLAAVIGLVIPQLGEAIRNVAVNLETAIPRLRTWLDSLLSGNPEMQETVNQVLGQELDWSAILREVVNFLKSGSAADWQGAVSVATGFLENIFSSLSTFVIAFVFACYMLGRKEKLYSQASRTIHAFLPERGAAWVSKVLHLCQDKFGGFITGQCMEACILVVIYWVPLSIGGFPYAPLISVIIALLSFIPIFGCYVSCVIGALLVLTVDPFQALIFVVVFVVIQQIESNLIYPRVVGGSVDLPGIWVLLAVSVGGSLFGIVGMLVFIPLASVLYSLLRDEVNKRMERKKQNHDTGHKPENISQ